MTHLSNHPHAFLNEDSKVISVVLFNSHDDNIVNAVKDNIGAANVKDCCQYGDAGVGMYFYDNVFYPPKPYESWIKNEQSVTWDPPIPYPTISEEDPSYYVWNEEILNWQEVSE